MAIALAVGIALFFYDQSPVNLFQKLAQATTRADDLETSAARSRAEVVQLSAHINALSVASRAVEVALMSSAQREPLEAVVIDLLDHWADSRSPLFQISEDELWNFAIYLADGGHLSCLHHRRNFGQAADAPRRWPVGSGHVGLAFQRNGELCTDDVAAQIVFQGVGELKRDYDAERYRGTVSICIPNVYDGQPLGVLVATSSRIGRYTSGNV